MLNINFNHFFQFFIEDTKLYFEVDVENFCLMENKAEFKHSTEFQLAVLNFAVYLRLTGMQSIDGWDMEAIFVQALPTFLDMDFYDKFPFKIALMAICARVCGFLYLNPSDESIVSKTIILDYIERAGVKLEAECLNEGKVKYDLAKTDLLEAFHTLMVVLNIQLIHSRANFGIFTDNRILRYEEHIGLILEELTFKHGDNTCLQKWIEVVTWLPANSGSSIILQHFREVSRFNAALRQIFIISIRFL